MKIYSIIKESLLILSVVMLAVSGIVGSLELTTVSLSVSTLVVSWIGSALIGLFLIHTKNDISKKLGYALTTAAFVVCLVGIIAMQFEGTAIILMLVAIIIYALYYIVWFVGVLATRGKGPVGDPDDDPRIQKLRKWKALEKEGLITSEEFEEKRVELLALSKKDK